MFLERVCVCVCVVFVVHRAQTRQAYNDKWFSRLKKENEMNEKWIHRKNENKNV